MVEKARILPHLMFLSRSHSKTIIEKDVTRWIEICNPGRLSYSNKDNFIWLIDNYPEFRSLFYYRIGEYSKLWSRFLLSTAKTFYQPMTALYINTPKIGAGLFLQHGFSTIIHAREIGENCWINQQVTIGFNGKDKYPTIGNNVRISSGAKVLGEIAVGDNSTIGANSVVVKDVPPNCTVVGVPAYIIKRDGKKVNEPLK